MDGEEGVEMEVGCGNLGGVEGVGRGMEEWNLGESSGREWRSGYGRTGYKRWLSAAAKIGFGEKCRLRNFTFGKYPFGNVPRIFYIIYYILA